MELTESKFSTDRYWGLKRKSAPRKKLNLGHKVLRRVREENFLTASLWH